MHCFFKDNFRRKDTHTSPSPVHPTNELSLLTCEKSSSYFLSYQTPRDSSQPVPSCAINLTINSEGARRGAEPWE